MLSCFHFCIPHTWTNILCAIINREKKINSGMTSIGLEKAYPGRNVWKGFEEKYGYDAVYKNNTEDVWSNENECKKFALSYGGFYPLSVFVEDRHWVRWSAPWCMMFADKAVLRDINAKVSESKHKESWREVLETTGLK